MRRLLCSLVVGAVIAVGVPASPASAASVRVADKRGDVRTATYAGTGTGPTARRAPKAGPDVVAIGVTHAARTVTVRLAFAALSRPGRGDQMYTELWVNSGRDGKRRLTWVAASYPGTRPGGSAAMREQRGKRTICRKALDVRWDFRGDAVTATFPRRCLGNPERLRVGGGLLVAKAARGNRRVVPYDDALRRGGELKDVGRTYTPWVAAG